MEKKLLLSVRKQARYTNNEVNSVRKDPDSVKLKFALVFPDAYEIGMSNIGMNILYGLLNEREDIACERVFAPLLDYEELMRKEGIPMTSLENSLPLRKFDIIGFSLQSELSFTNVLNILDLAGIKQSFAERTDDAPIIIGGGPICYNPEPVADFFDAFVIGDGEDAVIEICDMVTRMKSDGAAKREIIDKLSDIKGVYVPALFDISYGGDGRVNRITPLKEGYSKVTKRIVMDLDSSFYPSKQIVPFVKPVHDRYNMEVARGCVRGCRFCHAGYVDRPYRERSCDGILERIRSGIRDTGYEEVSLLSLSIGDFSFLNPMLAALMDRCTDNRVAVSLPSVRPGTTDSDLLEMIKRVRKTGFTIAPEAGSERMRRVINKNITQEDILETADSLFRLGWRNIKLYFMVGLPFETMDDVEQIVSLSLKIKEAGRKYNVFPKVSVSVSNFIPKGHTPFQYAKQEDEQSLMKKHMYLKSELRKKRLNYKWHDTRVSVLEGVFSRGDRRLGAVIQRAWELGAKFDQWSEMFDFSIWQKAFEDCGLDFDTYLRERDIDETLPYDHIDTGVDKAFLVREYERARTAEYSPPCQVNCRKCGVCDDSARVSMNKMFVSDITAAKRIAASVVKKKLRFEYTKTDEAAYIGHLEMQQLFIRALSRAGIRCDFSKGFHPMPKLSFGSALPLGLDSISEFAEVDLLDDIPADEFMARMNKSLPGGMRIREVTKASFKDKSLFKRIFAIEYAVELKTIPGIASDSGSILELLSEFDAKDEVIFTKERKNKTKRINVKEFVERIDYDKQSHKLTVILKRKDSGEISIFKLLEILLKLEKDDIIGAGVLKTKSFFY